MKKYLLILTVFLFSFTFLNDPVDRLGVKGPLTFNKTNFNLAWTDKPNSSYYIQEYLPSGEKVEKFNEMLTIHLFNTDISLKDAVQQKIKELNDRKKTDPTCNFMVNESPDGKEIMVDFLIGESKDDKMSIAEFNVYRYKQVDLGEKKKGILVYAYSKRAYDDGITSFYKNINDSRTDFLNAMIGSEMPTVQIIDK
ncbi:hypothetical protein [Mucilaginibacter arboris]|uniref:Uncharacterized protein n=1 Tax=Mucilaginibacter arboris TaxID=2682090 RepID=A0A7K1T2G9_9SPHI|nr:hypothetical protein [Mucilaginibacter arboris]MVN23500.1 hypothetical protein [Mucilaginibacter arboris]